MPLTKLLACWTLLTCSLAAENIGPPPGNVETATIALIGDIVGGSAVDLGSRIACKAVIRAERFVKGDGAVGAEYRLAWEYPPYGWMPPEEARSVPREHGLWMLKRAEDGSFAPRRVALPDRNLGGVFLRLPRIQPDGYLAYAPGASPEVKLAAELGSVLEAVALAEGDNLNVEWSVQQYGGIGTSRTHVQGDFRAVVESLKEINPDATLPVYRHFLESTIPHLRVVGLTGVLRSGDTDAILLLEKEAPSVGSTLGSFEVAGSLWTLPLSKNLAAAHALARVALGETELPWVEGQVALMLGKLKRAEFLPYLAVMLDSPVLATRSDAISTLCDALRPAQRGTPGLAGLWKPEMAEHCHPIMAPVLQQKDVLFWKQWWTRQIEQLELDAALPRPTPPARYSAPSRLEDSSIDISAESRFESFVSMVSLSQLNRRRSSVPPNDSPETPRQEALLHGCISLGDDQALVQLVHKISIALGANTTKIIETMNAYRVQGKPQDEQVLEGIDDERALIVQNGMEDLRRALSANGWQAVEKWMLDTADLDSCLSGRASLQIGYSASTEAGYRFRMVSAGVRGHPIPGCSKTHSP